MSSLGRILILGANGQVGRELQRSFAGSGDVICASRDQVDVSSRETLRAFVQKASPNLILNAAAYTAVDRAESEPELARAINAECPKVLAEEAKRQNALLIHYSTDYVFDGSKSEPWLEHDTPNPLNVYGATKLAGEDAIRSIGGNYLIFRTSWVYGPHGKNFLLTMLRLGRERDVLSIVDDQIGAPTTSMAIADATRTIVDRALCGDSGEVTAWAGTYHLTCGGATSWYHFAEQIFRRASNRASRSPELKPILSSEYPTPARRPKYSVLSNSRLENRFGVRLPDWTTELDRALHELPA